MILRVYAAPAVQTVSRYDKGSDIQVSIDSVSLFVPSMADVKPISSMYLSHYEDVRNPAKRALKVQLDLQRIEHHLYQPDSPN